MTISAQSREEFINDFMERMAECSDNRRQNIHSYCGSINMEFAEFMRERWERHDIKTPIPIPKDKSVPDTIPTRKTNDIASASVKIEVSSFQTVPDRVGRSQPIADIPEIKTSAFSWPDLNFTFYGTDRANPVNEPLHFTLLNTDASSVSDAWIHLTEQGYAQLVPECLSFRELHNLCDWIYIRFVEELTITFLGTDRLNEARIVQMYVLAQSGYKVRIATTEDNHYNQTRIILYV